MLLKQQEEELRHLRAELEASKKSLARRDRSAPPPSAAPSRRSCS